LETRLVPAIHVTTLSDAEFHSGLSFRDAIHIANGIPGSTIVFDVSGQISLTQHELMLTSNMTIDGGARGRVLVSGLREDRVFDIEATGIIGGHYVDILHLIIKDGQPRAGPNFHNGTGGGIYVNYPEASLTLVDDLVTLNHAPGSGGGVYSNGPVTLVHTTIENNNTEVDGGGVWDGKDLTVIQNSLVSDNLAGLNGGGLFENGTGTTVTIADSEVRHNVALNDKGGGIWAQFNVIFTRNYLHTNTARQDGGGIYSEDGNVTVTDHSRVNNNTSIFGNGGGIWADNNVTVRKASTVNGNSAGWSGGGIYSEESAVRILGGSSVQGNGALGRDGIGDGGGIWAHFDVFVDFSFVIGTDSGSNTANRDGGGIYAANGSVHITNSSIVNDNIAVGGNGGGIWAYYDVAVSSSSTIGTVDGSNTAGNDGGGVYAEKGITSEDGGSITIVDSTFDSNSAGLNGAGLRTQDVENVSITFSCLSNNTAQSGTGAAVDSEGSNVNVYIVNTTFGANSARLSGAAIYVQGQGLLLTINHVTFNDNVSYGGDQSGSAIFVDNGATGYLENTLVDDTNHLSFFLNTDLLSHSFGSGAGALVSMGHNLVVDHSSIQVTGFDRTIGDIGDVAQNLDPLANYGGPTCTYRLKDGPAVGGADNTGPYEDQRHNARTFGHMDIGAYQTP
jgi:hypothetical protein